MKGSGCGEKSMNAFNMHSRCEGVGAGVGSFVGRRERRRALPRFLLPVSFASLASLPLVCGAHPDFYAPAGPAASAQLLVPTIICTAVWACALMISTQDMSKVDALLSMRSNSTRMPCPRQDSNFGYLYKTTTKVLGLVADPFLSIASSAAVAGGDTAVAAADEVAHISGAAATAATAAVWATIQAVLGWSTNAALRLLEVVANALGQRLVEDHLFSHKCLATRSDAAVNSHDSPDWMLGEAVDTTVDASDTVQLYVNAAIAVYTTATKMN